MSFAYSSKPTSSMPAEPPLDLISKYEFHTKCFEISYALVLMLLSISSYLHSCTK